MMILAQLFICCLYSTILIHLCLVYLHLSGKIGQMVLAYKLFAFISVISVHALAHGDDGDYLVFPLLCLGYCFFSFLIIGYG